MGDMFKFDGRIGRGTFWKYTLILAVVYVITFAIWTASVDSVTGEPSAMMTLFAAVVWLALLPMSLSISIRRWHDLDKSGWWILISLVPFLGALYAFVMTGFVAGNNAPNQYGSSPN